MTFQGFPKIPRLTRECVVTEKIDGTNASVRIIDTNEFGTPNRSEWEHLKVAERDQLVMIVGSRTRYIPPVLKRPNITHAMTDDNHGFAAWVKAHAEELWALGPGQHFGEWWGAGIQRGYGLPKGEKRFSLFNTSIWSGDAALPACCSVVPVLYQGLFDTNMIQTCINDLVIRGSRAAPGFNRPEGVIIYHVAGNLYFKKTIEKDAEHKGQA